LVTGEQESVIAGLRVRWREIAVPGAEVPAPAFGLWLLRDPDATIDALTQEEFDQNDERMPYFGLVWPSAEALVAAVLSGPRLDGQHVLDLGCGLGLCGFAAARQGARVTFFDWEPRALEIVAASAQRQQLPADAVQCVAGDWRTPPPLGPFDLILGADLLYERRNAPAVAAFLAGHLKPGAEAWIADPGRPQAEPFLTLTEAAGLLVQSREQLPRRPDGDPITLLRLRRPPKAP
jgi:2-polyprenyl-3-methyl-5-hydroxy-6-metoxy-1,4-benzoquinol methylase